MTLPRPSSPAKPQRRRPSQSRARLTAQALQQAFVQLLVERDDPRISVGRFWAYSMPQALEA